MADNVASEAVVSAGQAWAVAVGSFSGDTVGVPGSFPVILSGSEGSWTFNTAVGGAGAVAAGVQRMTLASDDPAVAALQVLDNAISGNEMQVDVVAALPAGTNNIGDVDAIQSGTWTVDLGATDNAVLDAIAASASSIDTKTPALGQALAAASVPVVLTAAQITTLTPPAAITGFATAANQLPDGHNVTVDNASIAVTGTFWQATQPVSGTVDLGATDNAVLDAIAASLALIDNSISAGNELQVDVVAALPAGTNNIGDVDAIQSGTWTVDLGATDNAVLDAIAASLAIVDDPIFTDDAAFTPGTSKVLAIGAQADEDSTDSVDEGDVGALRMTLERKLRTVAALDSAAMQSGNDQVTPKFAAIAASSSGDNTLVAAVASKKIRVLSYYFTANGTVTVRFESGAGGTALSGQMDFIVNTGIVIPFSPVGHFETATNTLLNLELSGAVEVAGGLTYIEVD